DSVGRQVAAQRLDGMMMRMLNLFLASLSLALPVLPNPAVAGSQEGPPKEEKEEPRGLRVNEPGAFDGLTIIQPLRSKDVHLVDMDGKVVHTWKTAYTPGAWLQLMPNGNLLKAGHKQDEAVFHGGGIGGVIQEIDWDGKVVWEFELATSERRLHHDFELMPNGNILVIAWEFHSKAEAIARGRDEEKTEEVGFWPDVVLELKPAKTKGAEVVWTWRAWDHLVQDTDPVKPGFGVLEEFPGRIDINSDHRYEKKEETPEEKKKREELEAQMKKLGYTGDDQDAPPPPKDGKPGDPPPPKEPPKPDGDFMHTNAVDYLPIEDLIVLSSPHLCELFVIDHSTTTKEAAGSTGGRRGHGGDLLWRWGNPQNYGMGTVADQKSFYQHDPTWLPSSKEGELRLLFFNNGGKRPDGKDFSSVEELVLPSAGEKGFAREADAAFGPKQPAWSYSDPEKFLSEFISGAQRLPNGNTLICQGKAGRVFEVTREGTIVWEYLNPLGGEVEPSPQGGKAPPKALFRAVRVPRSHPGLKGHI
ncbi:MAG: aryl-sulfate sulfotransferase, partial [Planctomycetota bacterium]